MSKLNPEDIKSLVRKWINEDWSVRSLSLGRGHWEEMAEVLNDAAYEQALKDVGDELLKLETLEQFHAARIQLMQGSRP